MHDLGLMGPDVCYIHMTDLTDEELDWIAETGGKASIAPYVEMLMGHGPPPIGKMLARGVRPSLSVDVVSSVPGEMFTQMRTALAYDRILEFTDTPDIAFAPKLTHTDVLEFATIDGARSIMLEDKVGSLTPGKQADIVLLKTDVINTAPVLDPKATIVTFADTSNVDSVFVAGNAVKRGGQLVGVDMKSVVQKLEESRNHILSQGGLLPDWCSRQRRSAGADAAAMASARERRSRRRDARPRPRARAVLRRPGPRRRHHRSRRGGAAACAAEIGGSTRGIGLDLAEPETIAERLADVGDVEFLVLAAIERDSNTVKDYDIAAALRLVTLKLVGYTEVIHALLPQLGEDSRRSSSTAASPATGPIPARRPSRPSTAPSPASCGRS